MIFACLYIIVYLLLFRYRGEKAKKIKNKKK